MNQPAHAGRSPAAPFPARTLHPMKPRVLAVAQLLRLPNVFTAFADIALAGCVGVAFYPGWQSAAYLGPLALLAAASGCLYLAGMAWNDVFDLADRIDWVAKLALMEGFRQRDGLAWDSPRLQLIDLQYADVRPDYTVDQRHAERLLRPVGAARTSRARPISATPAPRALIWIKYFIGRAC